MTSHPSLTDGALDPFWEVVRARVERRAGDAVSTGGRVRLPELPSRARLALGALLGRPPGKTVDLRALEDALVRVGVGVDLAAALEALGHPVSDELARRRADRRVAAAARAAARTVVDDWPETWAAGWVENAVRAGCFAGLDETGAVSLVRDVRRVLDVLAGSSGAHSRVDLAADLFGDAHALDPGSRLEAAVSRALVHRHAAGPGARGREVWELAGVQFDLTSAPALTWALPVTHPTELAQLCSTAADAGIPLHLSQFALRQYPLTALATTDVLVVENPRVVEAAAQRRTAHAVVATGGNPSTAVQILLRQLLECGATLRCHGDFDAAGLGICGRLASMGLQPWRMQSTDYLEALHRAAAAGVDLPVDTSPSPPTPWDPDLQAVFDEHRLIVHEERLLDLLLAS